MTGEQYDKDNPQVWTAFQKYAFQLIQAGRRRFSSKAIWERMRWESLVSGNDEFKLNNNYTAYYARKFINHYPQYEGFFQLREKKNEIHTLREHHTS